MGPADEWRDILTEHLLDAVADAFASVVQNCLA
jgi:hypothetical protein